MDTVMEAARSAGLDLDRLQKDLKDPSLNAKIGEEYDEGAEKYGAFGVPTIVFEKGGAAFLKLDAVPEGEEAVGLLESLLHFMQAHPYVREIKKPVPPG